MRYIWEISKYFHFPYEWMFWWWTPTYVKEITWTRYVDLTDAVQWRLLSLKAFWWCEQATTPTPTTPVDIVCNNWTLKVRKESWLPFRYKKVEYITASSTQWLDTWIKLASTDIVEAEYKNSSSTWYWALYWVFATWQSSAFYANNTYYWYDVANNKVDTWISVDTSRHTLRHDFVNWVITLDETTTTFTPFTFENTKNNYLFSRYYSNSYWYGFKWSCRKYRIYRWWELICDLVPVIDTQNNDEPWMYDLVSGEFRWNVWTWNFTAWAEAQDDIEVYVDGTKEKVWNTETYDTIDWNWTYVSPNPWRWARVYKGFGRLPAWTYKVSISWNYELIMQWKNVETWVPTQYWNIWTWTTEWTFTADWTNYYWIAIRIPPDWTSAITSFTWTIGFTDYQNTATCEDLLWVWDYKDEQEILSGNVIVKCWVMVLDGTEDWKYWQALLNYMYSLKIDGLYAESSSVSAGRKTPYCTHFIRSEQWKVSTAEARNNVVQAFQPNFGSAVLGIGYNYASAEGLTDFKAWLASQYNAWTPVIVVYPLATPTTLSVAWQHLSIPAWDSRIEIVEWSILDLPLYAKYLSTTE